MHKYTLPTCEIHAGQEWVHVSWRIEGAKAAGYYKRVKEYFPLLALTAHVRREKVTWDYWEAPDYIVTSHSAFPKNFYSAKLEELYSLDPLNSIMLAADLENLTQAMLPTALKAAQSLLWLSELERACTEANIFMEKRFDAKVYGVFEQIFKNRKPR